MKPVIPAAASVYSSRCGDDSHSSSGKNSLLLKTVKNSSQTAKSALTPLLREPYGQDVLQPLSIKSIVSEMPDLAQPLSKRIQEAK